MKLGFQPVNITAQFYGNVVYPTGTSPWGLRLQLELLFPKLSKEQEKALQGQRQRASFGKRGELSMEDTR